MEQLSITGGIKGFGVNEGEIKDINKQVIKKVRKWMLNRWKGVGEKMGGRPCGRRVILTQLRQDGQGVSAGSAQLWDVNNDTGQRALYDYGEIDYSFAT